jgi:triacylglycerol lipase
VHNQLLHLDNAEDDRQHYFRGIRSSLRRAGFDVWHSRVEWAAGVSTRARSLKQNVDGVLEKTGAAKVHVIGHSMGGLDARHMLYDSRDQGIVGRVASITTIGTPHWGSSFADRGLENLGKIERLLTRLGLDVAAFRDLRTEPCAEFNARVQDFEANCGVLLQAIAGTKPLWFIFAPLGFSARIIQEREGENDGLVSLQSARWSDAHFRRTIDADHLNLTGWWHASDLLRGESRQKLEGRIRRLYRELADDLAERFPL